MNIGILLGILLSGFATIVGVISTAIPYWLYMSEQGAKFYSGLWESCVDYYSAKTCVEVDIENTADWFRAVEALVVIGVVLFGLSCLMALCYARAGYQSQLLNFGALGSFTGAIAFTIALIIFGAKADESDILGRHFHAGFYLGIVAAVLGFLACGACLRAKRAEGYSSLG